MSTASWAFLFTFQDGKPHIFLSSNREKNWVQLLVKTMVKARNTPKGILFSVLFAAMLIISLAGTTFFYIDSTGKIVSERNEALLSLAKSLAATISVEEFQSLQGPADSIQPAATNIQTELDHVRSSFKNVSRISTFRAQGKQLFAVVTSADKDFGYKFLEPINEEYRELRSILTQGAPASIADPVSDRWGSFRSAQAPILDKSGKVIGAVKVDQGELPGDVWMISFSSARVVLAFAIASSAALAWLLANFIRRGEGYQPLEIRRRERKLFAEITLVLLVTVLLIDGGSGVFARHRITNEHSYVASRLALISKVDGIVHNDNTVDGQQLVQQLSAAGLSQLGEFTAMYLNGRITVSELEAAVVLASKENLVRLAKLDKDAVENNGNQARNILVASLVCAVALVIVRYASSKDEQVIEYQAATLQIQRQYQDVVENLPVGLFTYKDGKTDFANREWSAQFQSNPGSDLETDWLSVVQEDDRQRVGDTLRNAEKTLSPFAVQYRVISPSGGTLHLESRGIPLFGPDNHFHNLLGFTVDVTATVNAKNALQQAYSEVERKNKLLSSALTELEESLGSMVRSFVKAVEAKDPYTAGHSERVMQYSVWLGEAIGLGAYELRVLELGTLVHDVGKIGIPDAILTKPGKLTDEEFDIIKKHPEWGEQIIHHIGLFNECLPIVRSHHERLDGRGYPDGLKGDEISVLVRISSIADIFDAMTSTRAYRQGMDVDKVLQIMYEIAEKGEIDMHLFVVFCQIIKERGIIPQTVIQEAKAAA